MPSSVSAPSDLPGPASMGRFGDYALIEEIARGGMGVVYKARQLSLGRIVAVKMILAGQFVDKRVIQRFRGEVTTAALLQHPNIVRVHEVGIREGQHFFSMDYVDGQNLAQLIDHRPLPARKAAMYLKLIAEAIEYAHGQGVLHRDLKPSNVLIDASTDQPRITDFGLATRIDGDSSLTVTGQMLGSPQFMPPEQASADRGKVGRQSDVYALGAILYHCLTGRPPFEAESLPMVMNLVLTSEPILPRLLNPSVPRDLENVCLKCMEKEPARRYATAQELAEELRRFLSDEPVHARPVSLTEKVWRWCRRKPAIATLGVLVLVLVLVVVVGAPIAIFRIHGARVAAERARAEAEQKGAGLERSLYSSDMMLGSEALRKGEMGQVKELLKRHEPVKGAEDLRGFEWRYLRQAAEEKKSVIHELQGLKGPTKLILAQGTLYNLRDDTGEIRAWDMRTWAPLPLKLPTERASERWWWYPDQQAALAVSDQDQTIAVYRLPGFEEGPVIRLPGPASKASVSKDLRTLAVAIKDRGVHRILVWDLVSNSQSGLFGEYQSKVIALGFSPDGTVLATTCDDGGIELWSVQERKALTSPGWDFPGTGGNSDRAPFFAPSSTQLFLNRGLNSRALQVWDWSTNKVSVFYTADRDRMQRFAFSLDGTALATAWGGELIALFATKEARQIVAMPANGAFITSLAFSPSGRLIASGSLDRSAKLWDVQTHRELATLGGNDDAVLDVAFTPDERSVLTLIGDGTIKVWDLRAVLQQGMLWNSGDTIKRFIVSPDERMIGTTDNTGGIHVWDLVSGRLTRSISTGEPAGFSISFSPTQHIVAWAGSKSLGIWNYDSGQTNTFSISRGGFCDPVFSTDGRELLFADSTNILIWDMAARKPRPFAAVENLVYGLAFSPNGLLLASAHGGGSLTLWDRASGRDITILPAHPPQALNVDFSRDGRLLASGGSDATGKLWDVTPYGLKLRHTLRGHLGWVDTAFSPDGRRVVSTSSDHTLKLWDTKTGLEVGTLYGHGSGVAGLAFSRDGNAIYSAAQAGDVRIWRAPPVARFK